MKPSQDNFPVFEANQVLSFAHLNQVFNYLDEQERLTRANLIGIGIVCGLEIALAQSPEGGSAIRLSKGCGVTSLGYLIVEPEEVLLTSYREYTPPTDIPYPPFIRDESPYPLWELFPAGEPETTPLDTPADFLKDKAVLLFLELKKEGLRNCSLNNCDDKGSEITIAVRRLLIRVADLKEIIAKANALEEGLTGAELEASLHERLNLPELRLPRVDVPNTGPATSQQVLAAFLAVFQGQKLALNTGAALSKAYNAFKPLVQGSYPSDPFANFHDRYGFLDNVPANATQVLFLQYYYDLFDDLFRGYRDLYRKGARFLSLCCPPDGLFPRHLMLGVLFPAQIPNAGIYRHPFWGSPAVRCGAGLIDELQQLFARLVEITTRFTDTPPLPLAGFSRVPRTDPAIRITPSRLGEAPLSEKAIPYYYLLNGTPPLYQLWDPEKTRANRGNRNLGYRSDSYQPPAPDFVVNALRYDLEPYNFLRIEGHLGKNYQSVMRTLLALKSRFRLPIEVIALKTGAFDENVTVDLAKEGCRFQDLEALYDALKAESICFLCEEVQYFYSLPFEVRSPTTTPAKPKLPLLVECSPEFQVRPQTLGRVFEDFLSRQPGGVVPDMDPDVIINFLNTQNAGQSNLIIFYIIIYVEKLYEQFSQDLAQLDFAAFEKRYRDLLRVTEAVEQEREDTAGNIEGDVNLLKWEELDDRLEGILYHCRLDPVRALEKEYQKRVREVKQKLYLSNFLRDHPGVQHKAGVPLGGTFVVVYHEEPEPVRVIPPFRGIGGLGDLADRTRFFRGVDKTGAVCPELNTEEVRDAFSRLSAKREFASDPDLRLVLGAFTGRVPDITIDLPPVSGAGDIIDATVKELSEGTVIADFYLPYLCCSDCAPIQFVLPQAPPTFGVRIACTNENEQAEVTITPEGGVPPYSMKVDAQGFQPLTGPVVLAVGTHTVTIRDQEAAESAPQTVVIPQRLTLGEPALDCVGEGNEYVAAFRIHGGTPPYAANRGSVSGSNYTSDALAGDTDIEIVITDARRCSVARTVRHSCRPPLSFTAKVGCTSTDNVAPVEITASGGTAPYQARIDSAPPVPVSGPFLLGVGAHDIVVLDSAGAATDPQTVQVAAQLVLRESDFTCEGTATYRSMILIEGGTPPYFANGQAVTGNLFITGQIASGSGFTVNVTDQNSCSASLVVQHVCEQECELPCEGVSRRCAYRLWLQPPSDEAPYEGYRQDIPFKLRFNGNEITLQTEGIPPLTAEDLNQSFHDTMARFIKALNEVVNQALREQVGPIENRLVLTYQPEERDPFGILHIEHFVCETFSLEFNYTFARPNPAFTLAVRYGNEPVPGAPPFDGAVFINLRLNNKETRVPAFDCSERNRCTGSEFQRLCEGPQPEVLVAGEPIEGPLFRWEGSVGNLPENEIAAWVWDFPVAQPSEPFYEGQKIEAQLNNPRGVARLTAITTKGCFGVGQEEV